MRNRRVFVRGEAVPAQARGLGSQIRPTTDGVATSVFRQAPGYFRIVLGDVEITALYDGGVSLAAGILQGAPPEEIAGLLESADIDPGQGFPSSINAFLINTGRNLALIDTGAGAYFGSRAGLLQENLRASGYEPEQVDTVLLTHIHSDHALGLVDAEGGGVFARARVLVPECDAACWLAKDADRILPKEHQGSLKALQAALLPLLAAGRLTTFSDVRSPVGGLAVLSLPGHTPGHSGFVLRAGGESLIFCGDAAHCPAVQFPRPEIAIAFDIDPARAVASRRGLLAMAVAEKCRLAGAHLPFPGIGHVRTAGTGYVWLPVEYAAISG